MNDLELIFFDTFAHVDSEEINLDLVQFQKPVFIGEIRVIPLGATVRADLPGGVRLGATNPSQFKVEFFVNDLSKTGASTFALLGAMEYDQNDMIHFESDRVPTDGLVLRGHYTTITLAVYGNLTKSVVSDSSATNTQAALSQSDPARPVVPDMSSNSNLQTAEWVQQHAQIPDVSGEHRYICVEGAHYTSYPTDNTEYQSSQDYGRHHEYNQWNQECHPGPYGDNWDLSDSKHWDGSKDLRSYDCKSPDYHGSKVGTPEYDSGNNITRRPDYYHWEESNIENLNQANLQQNSSRKRPRSPPNQLVRTSCSPQKSERSSSIKRGLSGMTKAEESPEPTLSVPFESLSPGDVESISEGDIPEMTDVIDETKGQDTPLQSPKCQSEEKSREAEFEPILSDDDIGDDFDLQNIDLNVDIAEDPVNTIDIYNCTINPLKALQDPALTDYEWQERKLLFDNFLNKNNFKSNLSYNLENLLRSISEPEQQREQWISTCEEVIQSLPNSMLYVSDLKKCVKILTTWISFGLNFEEALQQEPKVLTIRHFKCGIKLIDQLAGTNEAILMEIIRASDAQRKLLNLYAQEKMAVPIKLSILKALDSTFRFKNGVINFISNCYDQLLDIFSHCDEISRTKYAVASLFNKINFYKLLENLKPNAIESILNAVVNSKTLFAHPKRFLPVFKQFEILPNLDNRKSLFMLMRHTNFIENLKELTYNSISDKYRSAIYRCLAELAEKGDGLKFLASSPGINDVLKNIIDKYDVELGKSMIFKLKILNFIDELHSFTLDEEQDLDKSNVIDVLEQFYTLRDSYAKNYISQVFSLDDNIKILIKLLKFKCCSRKKSICRGYICDLIILCITNTERIDFLTSNYKEIIDLIKGSDFTELIPLQNWLKPLQLNVTYENVNPLFDFMKDCENLSGELIMSIRILAILTIPAHEKDIYTLRSIYDDEEFKYKEVLKQFYAADGLSVICGIITKLYENRILDFNSNLYPLTLILCKIIRRILTNLIRTRNIEFKDLTMIPVLLKIYLRLFGNINDIYVRRIFPEIIGTLLSYTQPYSSDSTETEALNKNLWSQMLLQILQFTVDSPENFIPGLSILCELLPLPLPIQTCVTVEKGNIVQNINQRKLWAAQLHSQNKCIEELLSTLCSSSNPYIIHYLRRFCIQLADLSAPTAQLVTQSILDTIAIEKNIYNLNFLAQIVNHAPIKFILLHLIYQRKDEKYLNILLNTLSDNDESLITTSLSIFLRLCDIEISLTDINDEESFLATSVPPKENLLTICSTLMKCITNNVNRMNIILHVLRIFYVLAEHDYGLFHVKNALLKHPETLTNIAKAIEMDWGKDTHLTLTTLSTLMDFLKLCYTTDECQFYFRTKIISLNEMKKIVEWKPPNDVEHQPLRNLVELLKKSIDEDLLIPELLKNIKDFIKLLDYNSSDDCPEFNEPILPAPPDSLLSQFTNRRIFVYIENGRADQRLSPNFWFNMPNFDSQPSSQYVTIDLLEIAKTTLNENSFLEEVAKAYKKNTIDETKYENDRIQATMNKKRQQTTEGELKRPFIAPMRGRSGAVSVNSSHPVAISTSVSTTSSLTVINTSTNPYRTINVNVATNPAAAVSGQIAMNLTHTVQNSLLVNRGDLFRSRPPNTSRPPSLHVDDFVALETRGAQPTGPTGYNKQTMRAAQDILSNRRGRGRQFPQLGGSRFFTQALPPHYRDPNQFQYYHQY